ncbi:MAG: hypothetical protein AB7O43_15005 [Hyphomicrobiaceae bacterium]
MSTILATTDLRAAYEAAKEQALINQIGVLASDLSRMGALTGRNGRLKHLTRDVLDRSRAERIASLQATRNSYAARLTTLRIRRKRRSMILHAMPFAFGLLSFAPVYWLLGA